MSENYIKNVVEAALLAAGRPLQLTELTQLFDENVRPEPAALREALGVLEADYGSRGIEVKETATGFRIQVRKEMANEVSRLWPERPPKYSRALLETLALIAYRQPITRGEIEAVRGVAVNPNIIKTVIERNWVRVVGTRDVPGRPELLGTTKDFLDYFGLRALDELPPLAELKAMGEINLQLDLAKPSDPGSDDGSGSSGTGGANGAGEGGSSSSGTPDDSSAAAATAAVAMGVVAAATIGEASEVEASASDNLEVNEAASAATEGLTEAATPDTAATHDDAVAELVASSDNAESEPLVALPTEELVAYEHDPHSVTITHVDIESDASDVTVEVEALTFVEQQLESEERARDTSIETGEFEMSELGMTTRPATVIEAEFEVEDLSGAQTDEDEAADDEEELSAGPQSSTELVAAPRDRDD
jgi:segregation and condensation protein B